MWYSNFSKTALRKHNLRVDFRVYAGDEEKPPVRQELESKLKSILSSAIIKGLDIIGIVSKYGIEAGELAKQIAKSNGIDLKILSGQDYVSKENVKAVFFELKNNIPSGLPLKEAILQTKKLGGKCMVYDLSKRNSKIINTWKGHDYCPEFVEIFNAHSKAYKDLNIDLAKVVSSASRSGTDLENTPIYTEISRKYLSKIGLISEDEGINFTPEYLKGATNG